MIKVINSKQAFLELTDELLQFSATVVPIFKNNSHYKLTDISILFIFIRSDVYILSIDHNDGINISNKIISKLPCANYIVPNKKQLIDIFPETLIDLRTLYYIEHGTALDLSSKILDDYSIKYSSVCDVNTCIPLMKLLEYAQSIHDIVLTLNVNKLILSDEFKFMNDVAIPTYHFIESSGIYANKCLADQYYKSDGNSNLIYTDYFPFTATGRPSNTFNNINFSAVNKSDGSRKEFISRFNNGKIVLIDFESFHLRLIANLIKYPQPTIPFHEYLAKIYYQTDNITSEQYSEGKQLTFSILYGNVDVPIEFFEKIQIFKKELWTEITNTGYVKTPHGRKLRLSNIEDPSESKIFNYLIQAVESEVSIDLIHSLIPVFLTHQSKLILYTYDSILIDYCPTDGGTFIKTVCNLLQSTNYPVRLYAGSSYEDVKKVNF